MARILTRLHSYRRLAFLGLMLLLALCLPALAAAVSTTPVPGNCAASYPNRGGQVFDLVNPISTTDSGTGNSVLVFDDNDSPTAHQYNHQITTDFGEITFAVHTICVGDTIGWQQTSVGSLGAHSMWSGFCTPVGPAQNCDPDPTSADAQAISTISVASHNATLTTASSLGANLTTASVITVIGSSTSTLNGRFTVSSVNAGANQLGYSDGSVVSGSGTGGTVTDPVFSLPSDLSTMATGTLYTQTFNTASTTKFGNNPITYFCGAHLSAMQGYIVVNQFATSVALAGGTGGPYGTTSNFTATVSSSPARGGAPSTGTVSLFANGTLLAGPVAVASGFAVFNSIVVPAGSPTHVTAVYNGDGNKYAASVASPNDNVTITPANATVNLGSSQLTVPPGTNVTFTATVTNTSTAAAPGAGETVNINDSVGGLLGTATFQSSVGAQGTYTFSISSLAAGSRNITAVLDPSGGNFNTATSNTVVEKIQDFSMNISNPAGNVAPGATFIYNGTLNSVGGYAGLVNITCTTGATAPPATCTSPGSPVTVAAGASNVPFTVNASNPTSGAFSFNIHGQDSVTASLTQDVAVTLNVNTFTLTGVTPSATIAQGNPSALFPFTLTSQAGNDPITMSCVPPLGVAITCRFSNGAGTENLTATTGGTTGYFTINVASTVTTAGSPYTLKLHAVDGAGVIKNALISVTVTASGSAVKLNANFASPTANNQAGLIGGYTFTPTLTNATGLGVAVNDGRMLITFDQPVFISAVNDGSCSISNVPQDEVFCDFGAVAAGSPPTNVRAPVITVQPVFSVRQLTIVNQVMCDQPNTGTTLMTRTVKLLPRPEVHNNIPPR